MAAWKGNKVSDAADLWPETPPEAVLELPADEGTMAEGASDHSWSEFTLRIEGMTCNYCAGTVEAAALAIPGISRAKASFAGSSAVITVAATGAAAQGLADTASRAIEDAGYVCSIDGPPRAVAAYQAQPGEVAVAVSSDTQTNKDGSDAAGVAADISEAEAVAPVLADALLTVTGMTCSSCVASVARALRAVPGVSAADVSFPLERATVRFDATKAGAAELVSAVKSAGYRAVLARVGGVADINAAADGGGNGLDEIFEDVEERQKQRKTALAGERNFFLCSLLLTVPVVLLDMVFGQLLNSPSLKKEVAPGLMVNDLLQFVLATPVQFYFGGPFYRHAYAEVRRRSLGMSFLVAAGTSAAYLYSVIALLVAVSATHMAPESLYFETSAVLISFILLGRWLEAAARGSASGAVSRLLAMAPQRAIKIKGGWPLKVAAPSAAAAAAAGGAAEKATSAAPKASAASDDELIDEEDEAEEDVPASSLAPGDVVKVVRGGRIPADGMIVGGSAAVDESMVTGESVPAAKQAGACVLAASVVVEGLCYVRVTRTGGQSTLARIARLVEDAQASRAPLQEMGDAIASVFVPCVALLSLATFTVWFVLAKTGVVGASWRDEVQGNPSPGLFALMFALSVLVIACPCGIGLAAPTAVMVGATVAARLGVLLKGGEAVQKAAHVRAVLLDKTGTLTEGKPAVVSFTLVLSDALRKSAKLSARKSLNLLEFNAVLRLVAAAETASEHPIAKAVVAFAKASGVAAAESDGGSGSGGGGLASLIEEGSFKAESGRGVQATVDGVEVRVGSVKFVLSGLNSAPANNNATVAANASSGGEKELLSAAETPLEQQQPPPQAQQQPQAQQPPPALATAVRDLQGRGCTVVAAALDGIVVALLGVADCVRPESPGVVKALHRMGLEVWMVTGDGAAAARAVASQVGIPSSHVLAEVMPEHKAEKAAELQARGLRVAMVGDGINDAPALARADVGIAMGGGAEVAVESADVVLMRPRLEDLVTALSVCRAILRRIRYNYAWALGYNVMALPIAAGVIFPFTKQILPPQLAGGLMALSSVSVVLSSLALRLYRPPRAARKLAIARSKSNVGMVVAGAEAALDASDLVEEEEEEPEDYHETPSVHVLSGEEAPALAAVAIATIDLDCRCQCCRSVGGGWKSGWKSSLELAAQARSAPAAASGEEAGEGLGEETPAWREETQPLLKDGGCSCNCSACGCVRHRGA